MLAAESLKAATCLCNRFSHNALWIRRMDNPRTKCNSVLLSLVMLTICTAWQAGSAAAIDETRPAGEPTLQETLENGLKARRPVEFQFIAMVADKVERGELPRGLVKSTLIWARRQHAWPFPYFQRGIRERARRIGVAL